MSNGVESGKLTLRGKVIMMKINFNFSEAVQEDSDCSWSLYIHDMTGVWGVQIFNFFHYTVP